VLVGEVFGEEAVRRRGVGDEEAATGDAVMVAMVLLLQKIAALSSTPEPLDPVAKLSIERRTVYLSSELFGSLLD
jgi:hypothetical protein